MALCLCINITDFHVNSPWQSLWNEVLPPKIKEFLWRLLYDFVSCISKLLTRGVNIYPLCPRCRGANEDLDHIFRHCTFTLAVRQELGFIPSVMLIDELVHRTSGDQKDDRRSHVLGNLARREYDDLETEGSDDRLLVQHVDESMQCWLGAKLVHNSQAITRASVEAGNVC